MPEGPPIAMLHGVRVQVPVGWAERSIYRYAAPADPIIGRRLATNLVVTWHTVPARIPFERIFEAPNGQQRPGTFQMLASGTSNYLEQPVVWQDIVIQEGAPDAAAYQRQIAVRPAPDHLVILTLTSDRNDLPELSTKIGFAAPKP
jgi:hypothetical protein